MTLDEALKAFDPTDIMDRCAASVGQTVAEKRESLKGFFPLCPALKPILTATTMATSVGEGKITWMFFGMLLALAHLCRMAEIAEMEGEK